MFLEIARGRDGPIPFIHIVPEWTDYVSPKDLPEHVPFKEASRYLADESHSILKLWRTRQSNGEIPFKFLAVMDAQKIAVPAEYPPEIFKGLKEPNAQALPRKKVTNSQPVEEDEGSSEPVSTEDDGDTPLGTRNKTHTAAKRSGTQGETEAETSRALLSSPTVLNTSPVKPKDTRRKKQVYVTPDQSAESTPAPSEEINIRLLRSQTKANEVKKATDLAERKPRKRKT